MTGVAGFIGSHVAERCLELDMEVIGADDLSGGFRTNIPVGVNFHQGSITDPAFVRTLFEGQHIDYVYHLAAYAAEGLSHFIRRFNYTNNLIASVNLINASVLHNATCFVFTSSIAVYGKNQTPMSETMIPRPEDPYGIAKFAVELDLAAAHAMFGLQYIIFRPHNVYGERQNIADQYRNVIGIFMNQVLNGEPMTIFGNGLQTRAFSHVDDVAPIIARSPMVRQAFGEVFNVGADRPYTVLELAQEVAKAFGVKPHISHLPPRNEVVHAYSSHEKAQRVFEPPAPISLEVGIARMAQWMQEHGPRPPVEFMEIEVDRNLPSSWSRNRLTP